MIRIIARRNTQGRLYSLEAQGHSGYGKQGEDIVCAAVSALMQALATCFFDVLHLEDVIEVIDSKTARMHYDWKHHLSPQVVVVAETVFLSLKGIATAYSKYVDIIEECE